MGYYDTDSSELSEHEVRDRGGRLNREYDERRLGFANPRLIASLLALMNLLFAAGIVGGVVMYGKVTSLDDKVTLIIEGRIKLPNGP